MPPFHRHVFPALIALLHATASSGAGAAPPAKPDPNAAAFLRENAVAMDRMMAEMHVPPTGDVDRDFAVMMIPHHQGAVDMARALLRHGSNPELKALARNIIATQQKEIALMQRVLREKGVSPAPAKPQASHHHHGVN
ncbi:DUF305 domain-containing protein [Sphingomonas sp.]|uniref:DUF305 domain-containing protein n=1 Tax=Sphingomonas sp. TaxID=28214 RepID=UPI003B3AA958